MLSAQVVGGFGGIEAALVSSPTLPAALGGGIWEAPRRKRMLAICSAAGHACVRPPILISSIPAGEAVGPRATTTFSSWQSQFEQTRSLANLAGTRLWWKTPRPLRPDPRDRYARAHLKPSSVGTGSPSSKTSMSGADSCSGASLMSLAVCFSVRAFSVASNRGRLTLKGRRWTFTGATIFASVASNGVTSQDPLLAQPRPIRTRRPRVVMAHRRTANPIQHDRMLV